jgi:membrane-bound ClpP family serine protease
MFCSNCGTAIKPELNYCNRCGTRISNAETNVRATVVENFSSAVGYIGGFGLIGFIFVVLVLIKNGVTERALIPISLFYLATLFGICFLLIQQVKSFSGMPADKKSSEFYPNSQYSTMNAIAEQQQPSPTLTPANTAQLGEARAEPASVVVAAATVGSVTENTTKTLDEVLLNRR